MPIILVAAGCALAVVECGVRSVGASPIWFVYLYWAQPEFGWSNTILTSNKGVKIKKVRIEEILFEIHPSNK